MNGDSPQHDTIEALLRDGFGHINAGRLGLAILALTTAFRETHGSDQSPHIYNLIWNLYYTITPETAAGSESYAIAIAEGNLHRVAGRQVEALQSYADAAQMKPRLPFAFSMMANAYAFLGRHAEAHRGFSHAATLVEGWREGIVNLDSGFLRAICAQPSGLSGLERMGGFAHRPGDLVAVVGCDSNYYRRYAGPLVDSIRENGGERVLIHIHLVDPEPDVLDDVAKRIASDDGLNVTLERLAERSFLLETYYACARFMRMEQIFDLYGDAVEYLILDVDALAMADLRQTICRQTMADITFVRDDTPSCNVWTRYLGGAIHVATPAKARAYFQGVARYIEAFYRAPHNRFLDQIALYAVAANKAALETEPEIGAFPGRVVSQNAEDNPPLLYFYASRVPTTADDEVKRARPA